MSAFEPIPLAIGFTGHRDISPSDEDRLRAALKQRLRKLAKENAPTPLRAITGLAEGGDMLFAEAAAELGIEMIAVMPVEVADFVRDFEKPAHPERDAAALKGRFETLLEKAASVHVMRLPPGETPESVKAYGPARDVQYTAMGAYIVRQSLILIALWNGITTDKPGGTGDVVRFKREGVPPQPGETEHFPAPPDGGPVHHLWTTRVESMGDTGPSWREIFPDPDRLYSSEFERVLKALRTFNGHALSFSRRHPDRVATSRGYLLAPEIALDPAEARTVEVYAVADAAAVSLQGHARSALLAIVALAVVMVITFEFYSHLPLGWMTKFWITGYIVAFFVAYLIYLAGAGSYTRFLDYRCLAEGMRVQIFWHMAGLDDVVADHYLHRQRSELRWIRDALRAAMIGMPRGAPRLDLVREHWVNDQSKFFTGRSRREQHYHRLASWWADGLFAVGFVVALVMLVFEWRAAVPLDHESWYVMLMLIAVLPALAAAIKGYAIKRAYAEHAKQYTRMARIFSLARKRLDSLEETSLTPQTSGVLLALGREALAENAEWILLHRERQIEPPI